MSAELQPTHVAQSSFVTVVAWVCIVLGSFATLIAVLQNVMVHAMFPADQMHEALDTVATQKHIPPVFAMMFGNLRWYVAGFLILSATMLVSSIGLLRRKNWGRILIIVLMAFGIVWSIGGIYLQYLVVGSITEIQPVDAPLGKSEFQSISTVVFVFSSLVAVGFATLFGWLIARLLSPAIRQEFT